MHISFRNNSAIYLDAFVESNYGTVSLRRGLSFCRAKIYCVRYTVDFL